MHSGSQPSGRIFNPCGLTAGNPIDGTRANVQLSTTPGSAQFVVTGRCDASSFTYGTRSRKSCE